MTYTTVLTKERAKINPFEAFEALSADAVLAVMERFGAGAVICDATQSELPIIQISQLFTSITHLSLADVIQKSLSILQGSTSNSPLQTAVLHATEKGSASSGELLLYRKDGTPFWGEWTLIPLNRQGKAVLIAVGIRDISAQRDREQKLKDDYMAWRGMFDNAVEGIYRSTVDGHYLEVNPALAKMYGYESPDELLNQISDISHQIYVDPSFRDRFKDEIAKFSVVKGLEYQVRRRDGSIIWISESARLVRDSRGAIRYYEGFIEDITNRKEAEEKLQASQQKLLETSRQVGMAEMATSILHNMGNALNSVNTSLYVITETVNKSKVMNVGRVADLVNTNRDNLAAFFTTNPKGQKLPEFLDQLAVHLAKEQSAIAHELETLKKSLNHVNEIIAMQQNYAKGADITETVNLVDLVEDALRMNATALVRHGIEVIRDYISELPPITVAKHKVLQILMNLIRNAQKACDELNHPKKITIKLSAVREGSWVCVEVIDNGAGIPAENLTRIFGHGFTTRKDGHGFGLHSGALMARELGGTLTARSDGPGKGASFMLEIPCVK